MSDHYWSEQLGVDPQDLFEAARYVPDLKELLIAIAVGPTGTMDARLAEIDQQKALPVAQAFKDLVIALGPIVKEDVDWVPTLNAVINLVYVAGVTK